MENREIKSGFTLVEMLVSIAIIGALSIVVGVSASSMLKKSHNKGEIATYTEIFKNARIYYELVKEDGVTRNCPLDGNCNITLGQMVEAGLIDAKIYKEYNPAYENRLFSASDTINVRLVSGKKQVTINVGSCGAITEDNLVSIAESEKWGNC